MFHRGWKEQWEKGRRKCSVQSYWERKCKRRKNERYLWSDCFFYTYAETSFILLNLPIGYLDTGSFCSCWPYSSPHQKQPKERSPRKILRGLEYRRRWMSKSSEKYFISQKSDPNSGLFFCIENIVLMIRKKKLKHYTSYIKISVFLTFKIISPNLWGSIYYKELFHILLLNNLLHS